MILKHCVRITDVNVTYLIKQNIHMELKQEEILEGNKLIALYDGMEIFDEYTFIVKSINHKVDRGKLIYHSSWDALIPICRKIAQVDDVCAAGISGILIKHDFQIVPVWKTIVNHLEVKKRRELEINSK